MTEEEFAEWGREENKRRLAELANMKSQADLEAIQRSVARRRKEAGLSAGEAAFAVKVGQRLEGGQSLSMAMRRG